MDRDLDHKVDSIRELFEAGELSGFAGTLEGIRGPDAAEVLSALPEEIRVPLFRSMDPEMASEVITLVDEGIAHEILRYLSVDEIVPLIDPMASDDAAEGPEATGCPPCARFRSLPPAVRPPGTALVLTFPLDQGRTELEFFG